MCRGMGEQRRDNERGRPKDHRPALLATQTAVTVALMPCWSMQNSVPARIHVLLNNELNSSIKGMFLYIPVPSHCCQWNT